MFIKSYYKLHEYSTMCIKSYYKLREYSPCLLKVIMNYMNIPHVY